MLFDQSFTSRERRLALQMPPSDARALLGALLEEFGYRLLAAPAAGDLLLLEEGAAPPPGHSPRLWLTTEVQSAPDRLQLPTTVEALWRTLESRFHARPRAHIRIALKMPACIHWRYRAVETQVTSLSDMGCRFLFPRELAPGEEVGLHVPEENLTLAGKVIYGVEKGDSGSAVQELGLLFHRLPPEARARLRALIVATCLARVRQRLPASAFREGLAILRLSPQVQERLRISPAPPAR